jgi:hypothetical protein
MPVLAIKSGTTEIAGSTVKGSFSYFSGSTKDLGPTSSTGFYSGVDAPTGGYTVYQIGGLNGWTARVATGTTSLNSILISAGGTGSTVDQNITWATNTNSVFVNSGSTAAPTYTIGQAALGGTIAYILQPGDSGYDADIQHGLVATTADISTAAPWGCQGTTISGADGTAIGTGNQNTIDIIAGCATAGIAARLCGDLNQGGYSDWYLPSQDELDKLYINRVAIGGFTSNVYWSSTESLTGALARFYAWYHDFGQNIKTTSFKSNAFYVRAIRSF